MLSKYFEGEKSNLIMDNLLLKFAVAVTVVSQIFLASQIMRALNSERTILVPAGLDRRVAITGDTVSPDYVKLFTRDICGLAFNYSYPMARAQFGELLSYYDADSFPSAKEMFDNLAATIETTKTSSSFVIYEPKIDAQKGIIYVKGVQKLYVDSNFVDTQNKTYLITYKVDNGKFRVVSIMDDKQQEKQKAVNKAAAKSAPTQITATPSTNLNVEAPNGK